MAANNKVYWYEGMFLQPQHFQQHDRYLENLVEARCASLRPNAWGVTELELDEKLLTLGKFALRACRGVLPDGTPFAIPAEDETPAPLDVEADSKSALIYLAVPARLTGEMETDSAEQVNSLSRYTDALTEVRDSSAEGEANSTELRVAKLRLTLLPEGAERAAHVCIPVGRVAERHPDGQLELDGEFIPPALDYQASAVLKGFLNELHGLLQNRGTELAARIATPDRGGVPDVADFLMLQVVNRNEMLLQHLANLSGVHPELFYRYAVQLAGELATFTMDSKRPVEFPGYVHEDLKASFGPVMTELRRSLRVVMVQNAIPIPLEEHRYGIRVANVPSRDLYKSAAFVLAVNAEVSDEMVRKRFPSEITIGPMERIHDLVNSHLPGVRLRPLPVAPRQIPFHAGFTYFELDQSEDLWQQMHTSAGCALFVAGEYPGLTLEFWAIRG